MLVVVWIQGEVDSYGDAERRRKIALAVLAAVVLGGIGVLAVGASYQQDIPVTKPAKRDENEPPRDIRKAKRRSKPAPMPTEEKQAESVPTEAVRDPMRGEYKPGERQPQSAQAEADPRKQAEETYDLVAAMKKAVGREDK